MSRREYVCLGLIILTAVTFGVSMAFVAPGATSVSSFGRMGQHLALVSLQGLPWPSVISIGCVVALIVLGIVSTRAAAKRRRAGRAELSTGAAQ